MVYSPTCSFKGENYIPVLLEVANSDTSPNYTSTLNKSPSGSMILGKLIVESIFIINCTD